MAYALWSSGPNLNGAETSWMLITVPFVLMGILGINLLVILKNLTKEC